MSVGNENKTGTFSPEDHKAAYIFNSGESATQPHKKRRVSKKATRTHAQHENTSLPVLGSSLFVPLLNGLETAACVQERHQLYEESWARVDKRIQSILRESNSATLEQVSSFVEQAKASCFEKIPSAFIVTGTNIAYQDLLFEQLSERLRSGTSRFIRLRSTEAGSLKAVLKRIIRIGTSIPADVEDEEDNLENEDGKRYLDYDLEALYSYVKTHNCDEIFIAFQDSEGFDSGLLSDAIILLSSWRPRIPFTLLFGVATSVDLLQERLFKSACRQIYGGQFDDVQTETILESVFKGAIAASDAPVRLGATVLRWMLDRQRDQVAGIQSFISSIKYAYMCHFFANPLSMLANLEVEKERLIQAEHLEAIRNTASFRKYVEAAIESEAPESIQHAMSLLEDDGYLVKRVQASAAERKLWMDERLRSLIMQEVVGAQHGAFSEAYVEAMSDGVSMLEHSNMVAHIRRMGTGELAATIEKLLSLLREGDASLGLAPCVEGDGEQLSQQLEEQLGILRQLISDADEQGVTVRSRYSGQGKITRTTVIAQRVQLSHDWASVGEEDRRFTDVVDAVTRLLGARNDETRASGLFLSESWLYEARAPSREVFVPRTRSVFERSLTRPQDYLACECCRAEDGGLQATQPATSILYRLYLEAGNVINVADLWSAFYGVVGEQRRKKRGGERRLGEGGGGGEGGEGGEGEEEEEEEVEAEEEEEDDERQREALVAFYRGLAELRALGYIKASKKKTDHVAKVKWL